MHGRLALTCGLLLAWLMLSAPVGAQSIDFGGNDPVLLVADKVSVDSEQDRVTAEGNVEISRGERRLLADLVRYDQITDQIDAEGNVILLEPSGDAIFADRVSLSGDLKQGVADQLRARLSDDSRFVASQGRRIDGNITEMNRATYTPCPICEEESSDPLWQITARRVTRDEEAQTVSYRDAFLEMWGVPVLYTPYFQHADPTVARKSGFLAPTFGSNSELGFLVETPYFFALAPNYDLTVAPIFTTNENAVMTAEYRHLLPNGEFNLSGSATHGTGPGDGSEGVPDSDTFRGHLEGNGRFDLGENWQGGYDLSVASDDTYLERYEFSDDDVLQNRLYAERIWGRNYAAINGYGFQDLREGEEQGLVPFALPAAELGLVSDPMMWDSRFYMDSSALILNRADGLDTRRLSTTGGWQLPWLGDLGDQYKLTMGLRGDAYYTDGDPLTFEENGTNTEGRLIPSVALDWNWPWIGDSFGLTPLIEPVVAVVWSPSGVNDFDNIPNEDSQDFEFDDTNLFEESRFPGLDRVEEDLRVSYGLRFAAFGESGELFSSLFGQIFRPKEDNSFDSRSGLDGNLSDYVGRVQVTPHPWFATAYRFRLDNDTLTPERNEVQALVGPERLRFNVNFLSLEDDPDVVEEAFDDRKEITAGVLLGLTESLAVRGQMRRDLQEDSAISNTFGLVYRHPCLIVIAGVERRFTENRDARGETSVSVRLSFQNIGEFSADPGPLGF